MRYRPLGESGIEASVVALGAWAIGGWPWGGTDEAAAIDAIRAGLDAGMNFVDTAPAYGLGLSEEIVGKAVAGRREDAIIATKCGLQWHTRKGQSYFEEEGTQVYRYLGPESVKYECEQSLKRLGTDYIDLYQTHWQDETTPIADTMAALLELKEQGKIRAIGVSNVKVGHLEEYRQSGVVDSDQELYSMIDRHKEDGVIPYDREHNIAVLAYSPLAQGLLTGRVGPTREFPEGDMRRNNPRFSVENRERIAAMLSKFQPIADKHEVTLAQLTIAWTVSQPGVTHALVGARNPQQSTENAKAGDLVLSEAELKTLDDAIAEYRAG